MPFNRPIPQSGEPVKSRSGFASLVEAEKMIQIAILLPASVLVGGLAGAGLDKLFHQSGWLLAGILVGGLGGLVYVVRLGIAAGARANSGKGSDSSKSGNDAGSNS